MHVQFRWSNALTVLSLLSILHRNDFVSAVTTSRKDGPLNVDKKWSTDILGDGMSFRWWIDETEEVMHMILEGKPGHWLLWGVSESGSVAGSDLLFVHPNPSSGDSPTIYDGYAVKEAEIIFKEVQDWSLISYFTNEFTQQVEVSRSLTTVESLVLDRDIVSCEYMRIVYAHGTMEKGVQFSSSRFDFEGEQFRMHKKLFLKNVATNIENTTACMSWTDLVLSDPEARSQEYRVDTAIPTKETTLYCRGFRVDEGPMITMVEPIITNPDHVHHMHIHWCSGNDYFRKFEGKSATCRPPSFNQDQEKVQCRGSIYTFVPGNAELAFPPNAGLPSGFSTGKSDKDAVKFIIMEIHYDNPKHLPGIHDKSGVRIWFTQNVRQDEVGVLFIAPYSARDALAAPEITIPPQSDAFETSCPCPTECSARWDRPMNVFAELHHMHYYGISAFTTVSPRKDAFSERIVHTTEYYDHDFQIYKDVHYTVDPGDVLAVHCVFRNEGERGVAFGGSTASEMCAMMIFYYPRYSGVSVCGASVEPPA
eukprot:g4101.t1